jgi:hypothetical protein
MGITELIGQRLRDGLVIPACPLALNPRRRLDERRQRALFRYYKAAGAGGIAVGVHTTQFAIHDPKIGLFDPLLELAAATVSHEARDFVLIAGICGRTKQAVTEALRARERGFHAGLLSLGAFQDATENELIQHCVAVGKVLPIFGFYLQPAAGGRVLSYRFWRRLAEIDSLIGIKIAPFNRYQTLDVVRATVESGRDDVALYTGNDDSILLDLLTPFRFERNGKTVERRIVGGLLGHWAVWTRKAVELHERCRDLIRLRAPIPQDLLSLAAQVTDANAAFFDAAHYYAGCIPGLHEVLHRQGLLAGKWCLDPREKLSPGQLEEIRRVYRAYPHLNDDAFVAQNLDQWIRD